MAQVRIEARPLPEAPLDAAAAFHARILPEARRAAGSDIVLLFDSADHTHEHWRTAAVEELAREAAPSRVNGAVGGSSDAVAALCDYLGSAPGVTGQLFAVDGNSREKA
ncbi:Rossmann fold domain-containing protein [Aurantiacibacter hainanensis]|uniref:Rossmann fold domain-containing protein n=1 Tax=Aurantiacibacter hainanensis TaxID=3076114 RepID=UPI0030C660F6